MPEKVYYHSQVFHSCLSFIENMNIESFSLRRKLDVAIYLVSDFEERAFSLYGNRQRKNELIRVAIEFIGRVMKDFNHLENENRYHFPHTFDYVSRTSNKYDYLFDNLSDNSFYYRFIENFYPIAEAGTEERRRYVRLTPSSAFNVINGIIHAIVKDINDDDDWRKINAYYRREFRDEINRMEDEDVNRWIDNVKGMPIAFLSYAFDDRAYTLHLHNLFINNGVFLYVDDLFDYGHDNSYSIKKALFPWIKMSKYFIFLRSIKSESISSIRPWCSWEIGNSFTKPSKKCFKIDIFGVRHSLNKLIGDFEVFSNVYDGEVIGL